MASPEFDSPFPGDNDITRYAQEALLKARESRVVDPSRVPEDVGIETVD